MSTPTLRNLNPLAPEYFPVPPGITPPQDPQSPFPFFPPLAAAFHQPSPPPPQFFSPQIITYIPTPSISEQTYTYNNYNLTNICYYTSPQNFPTATNPTRPPPPSPPPRPPQVAVVHPRRGFSRQERGLRAGGGRGRGSGRNKERGFHLKYERRDERNVVSWGMQKEESSNNRHEVVPLQRDEYKTTVMIKNIPYDCPRKELIKLLDNFCLLENAKAGNHEGTSQEISEEHDDHSAYDFLYLPIDFRTKRSRGFAFVNFTNTRTVWKFFEAFHQKKWDFVEWQKWPKLIEIVSAKIQSKEALVRNFSKCCFECETDEFLPVCFNPPRDGSGKSCQITVVGSRRARTPHK